MIDPIVAEWIAHDQSELAQRFREALRPTIHSLIDIVGEFERWSRRFDHGRRSMMRRKIRRTYQ